MNAFLLSTDAEQKFRTVKGSAILHSKNNEQSDGELMEVAYAITKKVVDSVAGNGHSRQLPLL